MKRRSLFTAVLVLLVAAVAIATTGSAGASTKAATRSTDLAPSGAISAEPATTLASLAGAVDVPSQAAPAHPFINRPTKPLAQYLASKAAAAKSAKPVASGAQPNSTNTLQGHAALSGQNAAGEGGWFPPDINGSVGSTQVATVTNSHISVYTKAPNAPSLIAQKTLNTLVGASGGPVLFDPRIEYDVRWNRWVFVSDSFADGSGNQHLYIAISNNYDASGGWTVYAIPWNSNVSFLDYPQVGLSQDAVIVTFNNFPNAGGENAYTFAVAKTILYNAQGFSVPLFSLGGGTATPPNVIDQSPRVHELLQVENGSVSNGLFQNMANGAYASFQSLTAIPGVSGAVPPQAPQPGACSATSCNIDTSDGRFVNDPTQYDITLWAVNTVTLGSFSAPHWYQINAEGPSKNTVNQGAYVFKSGTSYDWNASIVALAGGRAMVTWSWDDPANSVNPSMAMTGRIPTDSPGTMNTPTNVFTSAHNLQGNYDSNFGAQRWGDTSSIRYDPGTARTFGFNETVSSDGTAWGSHQGVLSLS